MAGTKLQNNGDFKVRASLPQYFRIAAIFAAAIAVLVVAASFFNARSKSPFRLKSEHAQLSTDVVSEINGYERLETDNGVTKYFIKADHAKTFSDNHQELENVYLEVYAADGAADKMAAQSALYIPEPDKNFTAYLRGDVKIETRDALKVKTNHLTYTKASETAEADELVEFERDGIRGKAVGALVKIAEKRIELHKDVEIEAFESPELAKANIRYAKITSVSAVYDQSANRIEVNQNVAVNISSKAKDTGKPQSTDVRAQRALVNFEGADAKEAQLKTLELFDEVRIASVEEGGSPTNIDAGYALYDKMADRFELRQGAHIVATAGDKPTDIRANEAVFERAAHKLALTGNVDITQAGDNLKGDSCHANLFPDNKIKDAVLRGNASARQANAGRTTIVSAPELNAYFAESRQMRSANAVGPSNVEIVPATPDSYTRVTVAAGRGIGVSFLGDGLIEKMVTDGRTTVNLNSPNSSASAANKRVTADSVTTLFQTNGKDIRRTEAVGNAELYVEPLTAAPANYRTTLTAPRFDCDFFPTGNNAKKCVAGKKAKSVRVPTVRSEKRGDQTLTADQLTANFSERTNDVDTLEAAGSAKFTELNRTAIARQMTFTQSDETIRLRGGEPTAWDSSARAKANEIDWDTRAGRSYLRGAVATTYYSRKTMKDSAPFGASEKPVFVTSDTAEFDHAAETANYLGNARGWQENNYVRGDRLFVDQVAGKLLVDGNVQSVLYNAKVKQKGKESTVPTYAASKTMTYDRGTRVLQYRNSVDIRQGTDRITAGVADVYLDDNNEVSKTIAENNVVITQPARKASGDWAQYTAADETAILRGNPASISDAENGSSQSPQLTFSMRDNKFTSEARPKAAAPGRTRSVYKVKPN